MKIGLLAFASLGVLMAGGLAIAQSPSNSTSSLSMVSPAGIMTSVPAGSITVTEWYQQNIYDVSNTKLGDITDVLVSPADGKITALIVGVGGFLGMGEKEVAVTFDFVKRSMKDEKVMLTMNATKEQLMAAPGFKYDRKSATWTMAAAKKN